jgi:uncharacterized protein (TIGR02246 family)
MNIQFTPKSVSVYLLLTAFLALILFFATRFLTKGTATEPQDNIQSHTSVTAPEKAVMDNAAEKTSDESADTAPDKTVQQLVETWNRGKPEEIAGLFMADGTLVIPTGSEIQSRDQIQKTISEKRAGVLKETTLSNTVDQVTRPDENTALVQGTYKLEGIKVLGVSTNSTGSYKIRQVKRDGRWFISRAEVIGREKG